MLTRLLRVLSRLTSLFKIQKNSIRNAKTAASNKVLFSEATGTFADEV